MADYTGSKKKANITTTTSLNKTIKMKTNISNNKKK